MNSWILLAREEMGEVREYVIAQVDGVKAVSYTHLDVYKRQVLTKAAKIIDAADKT